MGENHDAECEACTGSHRINSVVYIIFFICIVTNWWMKRLGAPSSCSALGRRAPSFATCGGAWYRRCLELGRNILRSTKCLDDGVNDHGGTGPLSCWHAWTMRARV